MRKSRGVLVGLASSAIVGVSFVFAPASVNVPLTRPGSAEDGVFVGESVHNPKGDYQLQIVVKDGVVTDVQFLAAGTQDSESIGVNGRALPLLKERILAAQSWDVEYVSGASYTSPAMVESAKSAFEKAGLA